jgi:hypothetical protein
MQCWLHCKFRRLKITRESPGINSYSIYLLLLDIYCLLFFVYPVYGIFILFWVHVLYYILLFLLLDEYFIPYIQSDS